MVFAEEVPDVVTDPASAVRWMVEDLGLGHRLVFGSATPFATWWGSSAADDATIVRDAIGTADVLDAVLAGNAERLLGRGGDR